MTATILSRAAWSTPVRPVKIVHLGIGSFSRAHQAWYTQQSDSRLEWGIAAFTGRTPYMAHKLSAQGGLYTLVERGPQQDRLSLIDVISAAHPGEDIAALKSLIAAPQTAIVTLTLTEAGYAKAPDGVRDSALGRLALALDGRRRAGSGPLALVSCDNVPANGSLLRDRLVAAAESLASASVSWIEQNVSFVSTSVDRITPRTTETDVLAVSDRLGVLDCVPVVCEPFTDWVLSGEFPGGRPEWEGAGARFVVEVAPSEQRKLWLLNGGHSLLAYLGLARRHRSVSDALADREILAALHAFWDLAEPLLPGEGLDLGRYRAALVQRFANARVAYPLEQIATGGLEKLRIRLLPVIQAARERGLDPSPALAVVLAWARWLIEDPARTRSDPRGPELDTVLGAGADHADMTRGLLELVAPGLSIIGATTNQEESA